MENKDHRPLYLRSSRNESLELNTTLIKIDEDYLQLLQSEFTIFQSYTGCIWEWRAPFWLKRYLKFMKEMYLSRKMWNKFSSGASFPRRSISKCLWHFYRIKKYYKSQLSTVPHQIIFSCITFFVRREGIEIIVSVCLYLLSRIDALIIRGIRRNWYKSRWSHFPLNLPRSRFWYDGDVYILFDGKQRLFSFLSLSRFFAAVCSVHFLFRRISKGFLITLVGWSIKKTSTEMRRLLRTVLLRGERFPLRLLMNRWKCLLF